MIVPLRILVLALLAAAIGCADTDAQGLTILDRFGPDGLPFTHDDPLAVGGGAAEYRYVTMGGDSCSEESTSMEEGAHGHGNSHPAETETYTKKLTPGNKHVQTQSAAQMLSNLPVEKPFDLIAFIGGVNLGNGKLRRWRLFPEDGAGFGTDEDADDKRGWGATSWTAKETELPIQDVWAAGPGGKNLHLDGMGLSMRDVKKKLAPVGMGIPVGVKHETLKIFPQFPEQLDGGRIDMFSQQDYFEAWVLELMDLDDGDTAISGNFVADLAGLQIATTLKDVSIEVEAPIGKCNADFDYVYIEVGGPAGTFLAADNAKKPSDFIVGPRMDAIVNPIVDDVELSGGPLGLCAVANLGVFKPLIKSKIEEKVKQSMEKLDTIWELVTLDGGTLLDKVREYSGLADKDMKHPFDKVAMGALVKLGQFKPDRWMPWKLITEVPAAMSFSFEKAGIDPQTTKEVMAGEAALGWRYNYGSTFISKSGRLFGNSAGVDDSSGPTEISAGARDKVPDVLESYAKRWVYIEMDVLDPYALAEDQRKATWGGVDLLFVHQPRPARTVDWPPPNFGGGRAQITAFRTGSGGKIRGSVPADVEPETAMQSAFQVCIDPIGKTYSVAGVMFNGAASIKTPTRAGSTADYGWTPPLALPDGLDPADNASTYRWLSAAANHHFEGMAAVQWMWDFEADGRIDSEHAQHMSDVGDSSFGAVFAYEPNVVGGAAKGRTGFAMVPMTQASRDLLAPTPP